MIYRLLFLSFLLSACSNTDFAGAGPVGSSTKGSDKNKGHDAGTNDTDSLNNGSGDAGTDENIDGDDANSGDHLGTDQNGTPQEPGEDDEDIAKDIDLPLHFEAFQGKAANTNCVSVQINDNAAVQVGCNKGTFTPQTLKAKSKPFCNRVRIINKNVSINATISTENANQIRWGQNQGLAHFLGIKLFEVSPGTIEGQLNDNGDKLEDIDVRFQVSGLDAINYTIENSNQGCKPKAAIP